MKGERGRRLRAEGQRVSATAFVGREGLTPAVGAEVAAQLEKRGLVKVKIAPEAAGQRGEIADALASQARADLVEVRGFTVVLAKRSKASREGKRASPHPR